MGCRDGPAAHPQLLDHRPHRPREVDAGRPHPGGHRHRDRTGDARAAPRLDGARTGARDHDQGAGRPCAVEGPPAEPDRHARTRRLHLRGLAVAPGLRGRVARRRRGAGRRGPDGRERLSRDRERPRDRPGREQDRPADRRPGRRRRRGRGARRATTRTACSGSRRRPATESRRCWTRSSNASLRPSATRTPRRGRSSSTPPTTSTAAWSRSSASWTASSRSRERVRAMAQGTRFEAEELGFSRRPCGRWRLSPPARSATS